LSLKLSKKPTWEKIMMIACLIYKNLI
jgi:hypothetical protein